VTRFVVHTRNIRFYFAAIKKLAVSKTKS